MESTENLVPEGKGSEISTTDSESEMSVSHELSDQKKPDKALWASDMAETNHSLSMVVTCNQALVLNVSSGLLASLGDLIEKETFSLTTARITNNLGVPGTVLYTEIKVIEKYFTLLKHS